MSLIGTWLFILFILGFNHGINDRLLELSLSLHLQVSVRMSWSLLERRLVRVPNNFVHRGLLWGSISDLLCFSKHIDCFRNDVSFFRKGLQFQELNHSELTLQIAQYFPLLLFFVVSERTRAFVIKDDTFHCGQVCLESRLIKLDLTVSLFFFDHMLSVNDSHFEISLRPVKHLFEVCSLFGEGRLFFPDKYRRFLSLYNRFWKLFSDLLILSYEV